VYHVSSTDTSIMDIHGHIYHVYFTMSITVFASD